MSTANETLQLINSRRDIEAAQFAIITCSADCCNTFRSHGMNNAVHLHNDSQVKLLASFTNHALVPEYPAQYEAVVNIVDLLIRAGFQVTICRMPETFTNAGLSQSIIANINPLKKSA
jgi:hypothetical protein